MVTEAWAARKEDRVLTVDDRSYSGLELHERVTKLARVLAKLGVSERSRVGVLTNRADDLACTLLALTVLRAGALLFSSAFKPSEIERYIDDSQLGLVVVDAPNRERLRQTHLELHELERLGSTQAELALVRIAGAQAVFSSGTPEEQILQFTSGSSGRAKIACRTFDNVAEEVATYGAAVRLGPGDRVLALVPLYHAYGLIDGLLAAAAHGATLSLPPRTLPSDILRAVMVERPTLVLSVPFVYEQLSTHMGDGAGCFEQARYCFCAGAKASSATLRGFHARFGSNLNQLYGTTETGVIAFDSAGGSGGVGRPLPNRTLELIDEQGQPCRSGQVGRVRVRGPNVSKGYLNRPELNDSVFAGGWFHSSDVGTLDAEGALTLLGRRADFVNVGGLKVDPAEVEDTLRNVPGVSDAAVIGRARGNNNEIVVAYVTGDGALTRQRLLGFCRERLADYKVPREVHFLDELPRNEMGKLLKKYLYVE